MQISMVSTDVSKWLSFGTCRLRHFHGWNGTGADIYIQFHEVSAASSSTVIANGAVPKCKSFLAQANNGFDYVDDLSFGELVVALSSTEANLTLVSTGLDLTIDVDGEYMVPNFPTLTVVGDLTTAVALLQVVAEASGPLTLMRVDAIGHATVDHYLVGYAVDSPAATSKIQFIFPVPKTKTVHYNAGQGFSPWEKTPDQVLHQGLTIESAVNTTAGTAGDATNKVNIRAMYI